MWIFEHIAELMAVAERQHPAAALYGFMGWLTSRDEVSGPFSSRHGATAAADLVAAFCASQGYGEPPDDFHKTLKPYPPSVEITETSLREALAALRPFFATPPTEGTESNG